MEAEELGRRLIQARRAAGLRREDVAARTGLSFGTVRNMEIGRHSTTVDTLDRVCDVLGISLTELFAEDPAQGAVVRPEGVELMRRGK